MYSSAKKLQRILSSREIRKCFIDYFRVNHDHKFVRSSPVVPFCDPTVAFVNAGMNQFKSVFLGNAQAPHPRVTNSQKCVRVGGKHNDLSVVGQDSYHHTFFEMLGNWSFGDYFKQGACEMAFELLRGPFNIDPSRLYVTYFAGDKILGLPADMECFEIWRSLGFPAERILPFGCKENFWEMGTTGPCGPCTEIHIDHFPTTSNSHDRAKFVNADKPDLTELWNLVFIQYNRNEDGSVTQLPAQHVDTGMGFERLTAILQQKSSNYDTDLFTPIFNAIQKITQAPHYSGTFPTATEAAALDTGYRILADHARMITACLADGMLPDQNQKLRRVLRKALTISENIFTNEKLLSQLIPVVVETIGTAYPEMYNKQTSILELIAHEQEVFKLLRESSSKAFAEVLTEFPNLEDIDLMECPGFVPAYRDFQAQKETFKNNVLPGKFLYKLTNTYGLTEENFKKLAELENMECDLRGYLTEISNAKLISKLSSNGNSEDKLESQIRSSEALARLTQKLGPTDNSLKYAYKYDAENKRYIIPTLSAQVTGMVYGGSESDTVFLNNSLTDSDLLHIVTDVSNFYYESGGQQGDVGTILLTSETDDRSKPQLPVVEIKHVNDCIVHVCKLPKFKEEFILTTGAQIQLVVNENHRQRTTCHHTATHLLNGAIRSLFNKVTYQVSSSVTSDNCKLELGLIGKRITKDDIVRIEDLIGQTINSRVPVVVTYTNASEVLQQNDITMVPGEIYPETGLRLISIKCERPQLLSKELCCGTHITNTQELEYFTITNLRQTNRARFAFTAVAGIAAENALKTAALLKHRVDMLEEQFKTDKLTNATEIELQKIRHNLLHTEVVLPYVFKIGTLERIYDILKKLKETTRTNLKEFVEVEMKALLQEKTIDMHPFIVHYITSSALVEEVPLQKATKLCTDRPILVASMCESIVKARCCVPKKFISDQFDAEQWLKEFAAVFKSQVATPKGQNSAEVCNMKGKKVSTQFEEQLEEAITKANNFAVKRLLL
ncbi:PREDICTED: alanine--tRNA ligase, mitochondrial [Rhagoletis zephyria]|uniref:alanine--tRNA ligase, mitochondrial n=1 Tax=Rhagoletis zephyria TaxID=28612 RepID=UPI0008117F87|nr:PREDICTED: alanine--tRNA ligase, mitochondrial [Rhagoletis zephyria]